MGAKKQVTDNSAKDDRQGHKEEPKRSYDKADRRVDAGDKRPQNNKNNATDKKSGGRS